MAGGQNVARRYGPNSASRGRPARGVVCYGCSAKLINWATRNWLPPARVLAIVLLLKDGFDPLLAPDFVSSSPWMFQKGPVPLREMRVYRQLASVNRSVFAIVQDRSRHSNCSVGAIIESGHPFLFQKKSFSIRAKNAFFSPGIPHRGTRRRRSIKSLTRLTATNSEAATIHHCLSSCLCLLERSF